MPTATTTTTSGYAADTDVPVSRSMETIKTMLHAAGADEWERHENTRQAWMECVLHGWRLRFVVRQPQPAEFTTGRRTAAQVATACAQEERRRWRVLVLLLKAKLVAAGEDAAIFQAEFLPYAVLPQTGGTVAEALAPRITAIQQSGAPAGPVALLPPGRAA